MEGPGQGEFAKLVANHVFSDVNRDELLAVVHRKSQTDEVREDRRTTSPSLDDFPVSTLLRVQDLRFDVIIDVRSFFN